MKVVCDACQAKYQIPDERVAGRKLKIRCRKCGGTIVIRGDQGAADRATAESLPPSSVVEWHVSLQGDQHGPYPPEQMAEMLRGGQLSWDAYVWRDSYADWRLAGDSDTLVRAVARVAAGATTTDDTPTRMVQDPSPSQPVLQTASVVVDPSAALRVSQTPQPSVTAKANGNGARMNGGARGSQPPHVYAAAISAAPTPQVGAYQAARVSAEALTGERHEDSVLFSAGKLTATATAAVAQPRAGYAAAEGSGLIDIRALAALARSNPTSVPQASGDDVRALGKRGSDEMSRLANQTGAFGNLDSISPIDYPPRAQSNALPVAILGGSAMIAVAGVIAVYLLRTPPAPASVAVTGPTTAENAEAQVTAQPHAAVAAENEARTPEPSKAQPAAEPAPTAEPIAPPASLPNRGASRLPAPVIAAKIANAKTTTPSKHPTGAETSHAGKTAEPKNQGALAGSSEKAAPKKEAAPSIDDLLLDKKPEATKPAKGDDAVAGSAPAKTKEPAHSRSIDELLEEAVPAKEAATASKKAAAAEAAGEALPETPSREQVLATMRSVTGEVQACAQGQTLDAPTATVFLTVAGSSGRVSSARVTGVVGAVGSCVANAVRNANFPKFAKAQFTFNFPFKLKP